MKVSIGHAAMTVGVSVTTLRRWEKSGKFCIIGSFRSVFSFDDRSLKSRTVTDSRGLSTIGLETSFVEDCTYNRQI